MGCLHEEWGQPNLFGGRRERREKIGEKEFRLSRILTTFVLKKKRKKWVFVSD